MPKSITIRDVPDHVGNELAARAARAGRSLQEYLRTHLIELANLPDPADLMSRVRERKERIGGRLDRRAILAHRDADRR